MMLYLRSMKVSCGQDGFSPGSDGTQGGVMENAHSPPL